MHFLDSTIFVVERDNIWVCGYRISQWVLRSNAWMYWNSAGKMVSFPPCSQWQRDSFKTEGKTDVLALSFHLLPLYIPGITVLFGLWVIRKRGNAHGLMCCTVLEKGREFPLAFYALGQRNTIWIGFIIYKTDFFPQNCCLKNTLQREGEWQQACCVNLYTIVFSLLVRIAVPGAYSQ